MTTMEQIHPADADKIVRDFDEASAALSRPVETALIRLQNEAYNAGVEREKENVLAMIKQLKSRGNSIDLDWLARAVMAMPVTVPGDFINEFMQREA